MQRWDENLIAWSSMSVADFSSVHIGCRSIAAETILSGYAGFVFGAKIVSRAKGQHEVEKHLVEATLNT